MLEKVKTFVAEHKLDIIEKGAMVLGAIVGLIVVGVSISMNKEEPIDDELLDIVIQ